LKQFIIILMGFIMSACSISDAVFETAIAKTQAEWTPIYTQTSYPTSTPMPTYTPVPTIVKIVVQTPRPRNPETLCKPIKNVNYSTIWKSISSLQAYLGQFDDVRSTSNALPEKLYSNSESYIVHMRYISDSDGEVYSRRFMIYVTEFSWKSGIFSIDGQCWIDPPH
jgi:hypothetical protein